MAGIQALAISGVRSFGPDDSDVQLISFQKPLTLILGQNGCGKTTIIESLRFAITGQTPPGSRNECFVYDAKVNKTREVMAQVKLKVVNIKGDRLIVSRAMQVQTKEKKSTFKTLDATVGRESEKGEYQELSSRCASIDQIMYEELGVSKAIINYVVFCHQEDSSWPLDEGKKVKERFDEIFDADKYSNCFDRLRKIAKEFNMNIKLLDQRVQHLAERKEEINKKRMDVITTKERILTSENKLLDLNKNIKPISEKLKKIQIIEMDLVGFETNREKAKARLEHCFTQQSELKMSIKNIFLGDTEQLDENICSYGSIVKVKEKELQELQKSLSALNNDEQKLIQEISSNDVEFNKLILLESQQQERTDVRNSLIKDAAAMAGLDVPEDLSTSERDATVAISALSNKSKVRHKELASLQAHSDSEEKNLQLLVDESRDALSRHGQKIISKEGENRDLTKQKVRLENEIHEATESRDNLMIVESKLHATEAEYNNIRKEVDTDAGQKEITEIENVLENKEKEIELLNIRILELQKQSSKLAEIQLLKETLGTKEKSLTRLKNKHRDSIIQLLKYMPDSDYKLKIHECECNFNSEVEELKSQLKSKQHKITSFETERHHLRELLKSKKNELSLAEDLIYTLCGTQSLESVLTKLNDNIEKYQDRKNELSSSVFIIKKYKEKLKDHSSCPLCHRGFDNQSEVLDLINELTNKVLGVPTELEKVSEQLSTTGDKRDQILSLKPLNEKIRSLKGEEIPDLENSIKNIDTELQNISECIEEISMSLIEPEQKLLISKQLSAEMPFLDQFVYDCKTTHKELEKQEKICGPLDTKHSLEKVTEEQAAMRQDINSLRIQLKSKRRQINNHTKKMQCIIDEKNKLKEEYLDMQAKVQAMCSLQDRLEQVIAHKEKVAAEINTLNKSTELLKNELRDKEEAKQNVVTKSRQQIKERRNELSILDATFSKIKEIQLEMHKHTQRNITEEIKKSKIANQELTERKYIVSSEKEETIRKVDMIKDECSKQEIYRRDLKDNMKLRKCHKDEIEYQKVVDGIDEKIGKLKCTEMLSEKKNLVCLQTSIFKEAAEMEGRIHELKIKLKDGKAELSRSENCDIVEEYRNKFHELQVTKALERDIKDYSVAMDKCLMQYHKEKMENINLIIRQMWRKIYRGNDIDYIEIKTEGSTVNAQSDGRRKYEYRVVQCKNGVEIDMRGRCSAGQKVLACLIIRLALAETFSTRFGVLALDEPTTNLDQENVKSLCSALAEIVTDRMKQKNFMFIIITHDKEFIDALGSIDKVSHYFEVTRNDDGKSRVKKLRFM